MNSIFMRRLFISFILAIAGIGSAHAQTIRLNNAPCASASVVYGTGTIDINTIGCGTVTATAPTITSGPPPATGSVGVAYTHTLTASGTAPITWAVSGTLPIGVTLSGATISGTPTAAGSFSFAVTASNGTSPAATASYSVTISVVPPVIISAAPLAASPGVAYSHQFTASQVIPAVSWAVATPGGQPPLWATLNTNNGILSGTPAAADLGTTTFSVIATNANGSSLPQSVSLTVSAPTLPVITGVPTATGTVGTSYSFPFGATGSAPITWSVTGGAQPAGLTLNPSTGVLSGSPTTAGAYTFKVTATNAAGAVSAPAGTGTFTITISTPPINGVTLATDGTPIPVPSKRAGFPPQPHPGPAANGAGALNAWPVDPARCNNTQPAIANSWHHNIDFTNHRLQGQIDFFDMAPNESITYEFTPTTADISDGAFFIGTNGQLRLPANFASISTKPCDFDVTKLIPGAGRDYCFVTAPVDNTLYYSVTTGAAPSTCKMTPGTRYYFNLRWENGTPGGPNTVDSCAAIGYARCGVYVQIR